MREIETQFFDLYKSVDSICHDMFRNKHYYNDEGKEIFGVSVYISIMEKQSYSVRCYFPNWDEQYRTLKRLRWIRTQIAHNIGGSECEETDLTYLKAFYNQLMSQTDILAQAYKIEKKRKELEKPIHKVSNCIDTSNNTQPPYIPNKKSKAGWWIFGIAIAIVMILLIYYVLK